MGISMPRRRGGVLVLTVLVAGIIAFLLLMMAGAGGPTAARAAAPHKHHAKHHARHHHVRAGDPVSATDPDNVQSGDQTTPDTAGSSATSSDPSGETSSPEDALQPGEPAGGHQDTPGVDVNNNCVDGNGCSG